MNTKIVRKDITKSDARFIFHQVNCKGVMGAGVAKAIREQWPGVYGSYLDKIRKWERDGYRILGSFDTYITPSGQMVTNLFAQDAYGRDGRKYTSYDAVESALTKFLKNYGEETLRRETLAFPWGMGAGLGGGRWEVVRAIIESVFRDIDCTIEYCTLEDVSDGK